MVTEVPVLIMFVSYDLFPWSYVISFILITHYIINYIMCFVLFMKKVIVMTRYKIDNYLVSKSDETEMVTIKSNTTEDKAEKERTENDIGTDVIFEIGSIDLLVRYSLMVLMGFISTFFTLISGIIVSSTSFWDLMGFGRKGPTPAFISKGIFMA